MHLYYAFVSRSPLHIIAGILLILVAGCSPEKGTASPEKYVRTIPVKYAKGFTITETENYISVQVRDPLDTTKIIDTYHLYHDAALMQQAHDQVQNILIPLHDLACLSTTHLGFIEALGQEDKLIAFSGTKYIFSPQVNARLSSGEIKEAGNEGDLDIELLTALKPDIIMAYNSGNEDYDHYQKLRVMHLSPVINNEYLELTPLGEAEWIKFVAVFFDALPKAEEIFDSVANAYNQLAAEVAKVNARPTVFTGMAFKGEWTVPGGKSFAAHYLQDAGADYVWAEDVHTGNFPVSLEEVIMRAKSADLWLHAGGATDLASIRAADERYIVFNAWKSGAVFNNNKRLNAHGGNDYWESGVISPQLVLADLIKIFHPALLPDHTFVYYNRLQ